MTPEQPPAAALSLDNCAREPIHIPGAIQPHGALLAFDRLGRLTHASANAGALLGQLPSFGRGLRPVDLGADSGVHELIRGMVAEAAADDVTPGSQVCRIGDREFDVMVHSNAGTTICEFEVRSVGADQLAEFAQKAYRSMDGLRRQRSIERLMDVAVQQIRTLTGFDRVMGYRFRHDDSGDVVAEARRDDLEPYVGRRYPASDIPAQARRLYTINTLRLIADVGYEPVPIRADDSAEAPLDLSHSVLRSVSPIHLEYLRNMGVQASMSVSIVVGGKLWGMIACHHMSALQVPYSVRMAADVIAQLMSSTVQSLAAKEREAAIARAAWLRTEVIAQMSVGESVEEGLFAQAGAIATNLDCSALIFANQGRVRFLGDVDPGWAASLLDGLSQQSRSLVHVSRRADLPGAAADAEQPWCGALGLRFDETNQGWLVGLRREQVETIRWGGRPDKEIAHGPLGRRLTPRGSFDEWRETVGGTAVPWNDTEIEIAVQLLDAVSRIHADRTVSLDRARSQLWAMLGHDLRNPLQSISMATHMIDRGGEPSRMSTVIRNSTNRMERLISDVLDISRLHNGLGLGMELAELDLVPLVEQITEEAQVAYPDTLIERHLPERQVARIDRWRFAQVIANLLGNARQHGSGGPVQIGLREDGRDAVLAVCNAGSPIPADVAANLFDPFKRQSLRNSRNPHGMGLGLFIANEVVRGHGGSLVYRAAEGRVIFEVRVPV